MGRNKGDMSEPDEIYKFFRITTAGGQLKPLGIGGGPTCKARCLFCDKEQSCQKNRLLVHLACIKGSVHAKPCPGPSRKHPDMLELTEEQMERKHASFRNVSNSMRGRFDMENAEKRKAVEVSTRRNGASHAAPRLCEYGTIYVTCRFTFRMFSVS